MTSVSEHETEWVSAHIFYEGDLDFLLTRVTDPLLDEFARSGLAREFFFLRYWDGGKHIRLRVLPAQNARRPEVAKLINDRFSEYLARNPSADGDRAGEYTRVARALAEMERVTSYAEVPFPNNSIAFVPYRREHGRYGYGGAIQAVERHFAESSRISLRALAMGATADQRATACFSLIMLTWFIAQSDPERTSAGAGGRGAGKSYAGPGRGVPPVLDEPQRGQILHIARQMRMLAATHAEFSTTGTLVDWARSIASLKATLTEQAATGAFDLPSTDQGVAPRDLEAVVAMVLDLCAHLICNRFGISPALEGALRRTAAEAVGALVGEGS
jgi:thiopeptide-type bacteriocin biosynthesis protein